MTDETAEPEGQPAKVFPRAIPRGNEKYPVKGSKEVRVPTTHDVLFDGQIIFTDPDPEVRALALKEAQDAAKKK